MRPVGAPRPATVYYPSVPRLVYMIGASLVLIAFAIWLALAVDMPLLLLLMLVTAIPFMLGAFVSHLERLIRRGPELVLTDDWLDHRKYGVFRWDEIGYVSVRATLTDTLAGNGMLLIRLRDPTEFYARTTWWPRLSSRTGNALGYGHVTLTEATLGAPIQVVLNMMVYHRPGLTVVG